jgi:hypothetical protein
MLLAFRINPSTAFGIQMSQKIKSNSFELTFFLFSLEVICTHTFYALHFKSASLMSNVQRPRPFAKWKYIFNSQSIYIFNLTVI